MDLRKNNLTPKDFGLVRVHLKRPLKRMLRFAELERPGGAPQQTDGKKQKLMEKSMDGCRLRTAVTF